MENSENFFDENILFPSCRFCGRQQIAEQKFESGQEASEWATMHCECDEAKKYQQAKQKEEKRNKNREKIREAVEEVAQYCQSKLKVFEEELKNFLFVAGEAVLDGKIENVAVGIYSVKISISRNSKGNLKFKRNYKESGAIDVL